MSRPLVSTLPPPAPSTVLAGCAITTGGKEVRIPPSAYTLSGFRTWAHSADFPARGHISFIDQELFIDMSPEEINTHALVKSAVGNALYNLNQKEDRGVLLPDRVPITNESAGLSNEPDGSFLCWATLEAKRARLVPREKEGDRFMEVEGSPDWVLEIVSDSSVRKDNATLRGVYYRAGVSAYWIIDARGEEPVLEILQRGEDGYVPAPSRNGWLHSEVFGRSFRLERRHSRLGLWQYTLRMRASR